VAGYARQIEPALEDIALVDAANAGDRDALDRLLRRHYDRIYAICRRLAGNDADAADATQEALLAIVRGLPRFDGRAAFTTWSYRVATNACLDELRRRSRRPSPDPMDGDTVVTNPQPNEDRVGQTVAARMDVDAGLEHLAEDFRAVVVLRDHLGLEYAEIAEVLEIPIGTVRSRLARGRSQLADFLNRGNQQGPSDRQRGERQ